MRTAHETAVDFAELFQRQYPSKPIFEILDGLRRAIEARDSEIRAEVQRETLKRAAEETQKWIDAYPLDIFPNPKPGKHGEEVDLCSARAIRHAMNGLKKDILSLTERTNE